MSTQQPVQTHTTAFFGSALLFLAITGVWNLINVWLLDVSVQQRWTIGMGIFSAMFAVVVVAKVVRDREEANRVARQLLRTVGPPTDPGTPVEECGGSSASLGTVRVW